MTGTERQRLLDAISDRFLRDFGTPARRRFFAPGRVNLVGAHLDYNGGDVLPMAVDRGVCAAINLRDDGRIRLRSLDQALALDLDAEAVGERADPSYGWAGYVLGVWHGFYQKIGRRDGFDLVVGADLPMASGLSSSAAIEVVMAVALDALYGSSLDRQQLALIAHRAENDYVGLRCGIMDQFASALALPGHVLLLHCAGPRYERVPFDPYACEVLVMDTKKPRQLGGTGFNDRVAQCSEAHAVLREKVRDLPYLANYSVEDLFAVEGTMGELLFRRARHVVTEMGRIAKGVDALREGDYRELGRQLDGSHRSTASDYEVSCDELDSITDAAREVDGVFGARLTGAGFGGCAIALIQPGSADEVVARVGSAFYRRFGIEPGFDLLRAGQGPGEL